MVHGTIISFMDFVRGKIIQKRKINNYDKEVILQ